MPAYRRTGCGAFGFVFFLLVLPFAAGQTAEFFNLIQHPDVVPSSLVVTNDNALWVSTGHKIVATNINSGLILQELTPVNESEGDEVLGIFPQAASPTVFGAVWKRVSKQVHLSTYDSSIGTVSTRIEQDVASKPIISFSDGRLFVAFSSASTNFIQVISSNTTLFGSQALQLSGAPAFIDSAPGGHVFVSNGTSVAQVTFSGVSGAAQVIVEVHNQWNRISNLAAYQNSIGETSAILVEDDSATDGALKLYTCCQQSQSNNFRASVPSTVPIESFVVCGNDAVISTSRELWTSRLLSGDNTTTLRSSFNDSVVTKNIKNNVICEKETSNLVVLKSLDDANAEISFMNLSPFSMQAFTLPSTRRVRFLGRCGPGGDFLVAGDNSTASHLWRIRADLSSGESCSQYSCAFDNSGVGSTPFYMAATRSAPSVWSLDTCFFPHLNDSSSSFAVASLPITAGPSVCSSLNTAATLNVSTALIEEHLIASIDNRVYFGATTLNEGPAPYTYRLSDARLFRHAWWGSTVPSCLGGPLLRFNSRKTAIVPSSGDTWGVLTLAVNRTFAPYTNTLIGLTETDGFVLPTRTGSLMRDISLFEMLPEGTLIRRNPTRLVAMVTTAAAPAAWQRTNFVSIANTANLNAFSFVDTSRYRAAILGFPNLFTHCRIETTGGSPPHSIAVGSDTTPTYNLNYGGVNFTMGQFSRFVSSDVLTYGVSGMSAKYFNDGGKLVHARNCTDFVLASWQPANPVALINDNFAITHLNESVVALTTNGADYVLESDYGMSNVLGAVSWRAFFGPTIRGPVVFAYDSTVAASDGYTVWTLGTFDPPIQGASDLFWSVWNGRIVIRAVDSFYMTDGFVLERVSATLPTHLGAFVRSSRFVIASQSSQSNLLLTEANWLSADASEPQRSTRIVAAQICWNNADCNSTLSQQCIQHACVLVPPPPVAPPVNPPISPPVASPVASPKAPPEEPPILPPPIDPPISLPVAAPKQEVIVIIGVVSGNDTVPVIVQQPTVIIGNLTVFVSQGNSSSGGSATLSVVVNVQNNPTAPVLPTLNVTGCVIFGGTVELVVDPSAVQNGSKATLVTFEGYCGGIPTNFTGVKVTETSQQPCSTVSAELEYTSKSLAVVFSVNAGGCSPAVASSIDQSLSPGVVGGIVGGVLGVVLVTIAILFIFRKKIFPSYSGSRLRRSRVPRRTTGNGGGSRGSRSSGDDKKDLEAN